MLTATQLSKSELMQAYRKSVGDILELDDGTSGLVLRTRPKFVVDDSFIMSANSVPIVNGSKGRCRIRDNATVLQDCCNEEWPISNIDVNAEFDFHIKFGDTASCTRPGAGGIPYGNGGILTHIINIEVLHVDYPTILSARP